MSTLIEIRMPAPAPDIEEVDVIAWLIEPGARVERGDPILEVETEKSTLEVEAPASGTLAEIVVPGGASGIAVGALLGRIEATASETPTPEAVTDAAEPARDAAPEPEASAVEQEPLDPGLASSSPATQHLDPGRAGSPSKRGSKASNGRAAAPTAGSCVRTSSANSPARARPKAAARPGFAWRPTATPAIWWRSFKSLPGIRMWGKYPLRPFSYARWPQRSGASPTRPKASASASPGSTPRVPAEGWRTPIDEAWPVWPGN